MREAYIVKFKDPEGDDLALHIKEEMITIFDVDDVKNITIAKEFFLFYLPYSKCDKFAKLITKNFKKVKAIDAHDYILSGKMPLDGFSDDDIELLEKYIMKNLSVDFILDKINESGIESLSKVEKEYLSKLS